MKSKAWWKKNWSLVLAVLCGVYSLGVATYIMGPMLPMMLLIFWATTAIVEDLWGSRNDI